jgi:hypothetical protein
MSTTTAAALKNLLKFAFTTRIKCFLILKRFKCVNRVDGGNVAQTDVTANNQKEMAIFSSDE